MNFLENYMTVQEYMRINDISHKTVYNWINKGKLETKKILDRTVVREKK